MPQVAPYSGDMLPIVARSASGSLASPGPKNSTNLPTTPRSRSRWVTVRTRSVAVEPSGSSPVSRKPTTCGISIETGWPSIAASASIPPTPAEYPEAVDHRRVGVGAHQRVGEGLAVARLHDARQVLEVDLVANARVWRHHAEVVESRLAPAQEGVAL